VIIGKDRNRWSGELLLREQCLGNMLEGDKPVGASGGIDGGEAAAWNKKNTTSVVGNFRSEVATKMSRKGH
jgi:hypothetical protein